MYQKDKKDKKKPTKSSKVLRRSSSSSLRRKRKSSSNNATTWLSSMLVGALLALSFVELFTYEPFPHQTTNSLIDEEHWKIPTLESNRTHLASLIKNQTTNNPILEILQTAGLQHIGASELEKLPSWQQMTDLYGPMEKPVIIGKETCQQYRDTVPVEQRYVGPAGMFNTGTNALSFHLRTNIPIRDAWQIPWGKHRLANVRLQHNASGLESFNQTAAMPIIIVRDPFFWMQSMCKVQYNARWKHGPKRCPNLVLNAQDHQRWKEVNDTFNVKVSGISTAQERWLYWDSLVHLWSGWYNQYLNATFPRLFIRFEDMLLQTPAVLKEIADCVGTTVRPSIQYQTKSAKTHGSGTDFLKALSKTGDGKARLHQLTKDDLAYARQHLDPHLMQLFQYNLPTLK